MLAERDHLRNGIENCQEDDSTAVSRLQQHGQFVFHDEVGGDKAEHTKAAAVGGRLLGGRLAFFAYPRCQAVERNDRVERSLQGVQARAVSVLP
jgi:hypothetical protein